MKKSPVLSVQLKVYLFSEVPFSNWGRLLTHGSIQYISVTVVMETSESSEFGQLSRVLPRNGFGMMWGWMKGKWF